LVAKYSAWWTDLSAYYFVIGSHTSVKYIFISLEGFYPIYWTQNHWLFFPWILAHAPIGRKV
jgi:hypothetical protein